MQGHVTVGSFRWWTEAFLQHGFIRRGDIERTLNTEIENARVGWLNCLVFEKVYTSSLSAVEPRTVQLEDPESIATDEGSIWNPEHVRSARSKPFFCGPGQYRASFHLGVADVPPEASPWLQALVFEIRSTDEMRLHGLRVIRQRDFSETRQTRFEVLFGCNAPADLEIRAISPGRLTVRLDPVVMIQQRVG